jgi:hypothetical protein
VLKLQAMYSVVHLEEFALTETAGYSACKNANVVFMVTENPYWHTNLPCVGKFAPPLRCLAKSLKYAYAHWVVGE